MKEFKEGKPLTPAIAKEMQQEVIGSEQKEKPMTHELDSYTPQFEAIKAGLKHLCMALIIKVFELATS